MSDPRPIDTLRNMERDPALNPWWRKQSGRAADEIDRLQATVEHLQDQCKEKHDSMIAMMNEALALRSALENLEAWVEQTNPDAYEKWKATQEAFDKLREVSE